MANVYRRYPTGRLSSKSLYRQENGDAVQNIASEFWESPGSVTSYVISDNTGASFSGTTDTYLLETSPTVNFGGASTIIVKAWSTADRTHALLKFDGLASVPPGTVTNARLRLYCQTIANDPFEVPTISAYALRRAFNESQATWNVFQTGSNWGASGALDTATDYNNTLLGSVLVNIEARYYEISGAAVDAYVQAVINGGTDNGLLLVEENFLAPLNQFKEGVFTSSEGTNGQRPELAFDLTASGGGVISSTGATRTGIKSATSGFKLATGVGASKVGSDSSANGVKTAQSLGASKVGSSANAIGQASTITSSISASNTGIKNSTSGFKIATGVGASKVGADSGATGIKVALSVGATEFGLDSSASGNKIAINAGATTAGIDNSANGTKTAQSLGASKVGSSGNAVGQAGIVASSIGATRTGTKNATSGFKLATGVGASKVGSDSSANGIKTAQNIGASKVGSSGNAVGQTVTVTSSIGASEIGAKSSTSGFKIAIGIGASKVGAKASVIATKTAVSVGAGSTGFDASVTFTKSSQSVGASRNGVISRPSGILYVPVIENKIKRWRGPEWITVSQGFWNS